MYIYAPLHFEGGVNYPSKEYLHNKVEAYIYTYMYIYIYIYIYMYLHMYLHLCILKGVVTTHCRSASAISSRSGLMCPRARLLHFKGPYIPCSYVSYAFRCVTWHFQMWHTTLSNLYHDPVGAWHDSPYHACATFQRGVCTVFLCVTRLVQMSAVTRSDECRDSFRWVPWLVQMSYDSFLCLKWLVYMCGSNQPHVCVLCISSGAKLPSNPMCACEHQYTNRHK